MTEWIVINKYIGREANRDADRIANWAARQELGIIDPQVPRQFLLVILQEEEGKGELHQEEHMLNAH